MENKPVRTLRTTLSMIEVLKTKEDSRIEEMEATALS